MIKGLPKNHLIYNYDDFVACDILCRQQNFGLRLKHRRKSRSRKAPSLKEELRILQTATKTEEERQHIGPGASTYLILRYSGVATKIVNQTPSCRQIGQKRSSSSSSITRSAPVILSDYRSRTGENPCLLQKTAEVPTGPLEKHVTFCHTQFSCSVSDAANQYGLPVPSSNHRSASGKPGLVFPKIPRQQGKPQAEDCSLMGV